MKNILAITIWFLFCLQPSPVAPGQVVPPAKTDPVKVNAFLKAVVEKQENNINEKKDSLSVLNTAVLSGELKPKTIIKYRYRTKIKEVHDTVYLVKQLEDTTGDYMDEDPCPDTTVIYIPVKPAAEKPVKKNLLQRIFKPNK